MNSCLLYNARIYDTAARGFFDGSVLVEEGRITALSRGETLTAPE